MHAAFPAVPGAVIEARDAQSNVAVQLVVLERRDARRIDPPVERIDIQCRHFIAGVELEHEVGLRPAAPHAGGRHRSETAAAPP